MLQYIVTDMICKSLYIFQSSFGLSLFLFLQSLACNALCGILPTGILSTCPIDRSLHKNTLSSRVVWVSNDCLMSLLFILCIIVIPVIICIQLVSIERIPFSSCFCIVQHSNT